MTDKLLSEINDVLENIDIDLDIKSWEIISKDKSAIQLSSYFKVVSPIEFLINLDSLFGYRNMGNVYVDDFNDLHQLDYLNSGYNTNVEYWIKSITINFNFVYLPKY